MDDGGEPMTLRGLREIVVQEMDGDAPVAVAQEWARSLALPDGVHIVVAPRTARRRPRRFVVQGGRTISPGQYTALTHADAVEGVLRRATRPLGAWDILQEGRRADVLPASLTMATIKRSALLLVGERRAQRGPTRDTWCVVPTDAAICAGDTLHSYNK